MVEADVQPESDERAARPDSAVSANEWRWMAGVFVAAIVIVVSRRPDAFLNAQFYIEDGQQWFATAHEMGGLRALLEPSYRGYLHTVPRLGAMAAVCVPLAWAPLVMNACAVAVAAVTPAFLASSRCSTLLESRASRVAAALLYAALPGAWTMMANMTFTQWHVAMLGAFVLVARPARSRAGWAFDVTATALCGLSGPTPVFLIPIAAIVWWRRRDRWSTTMLAVTVATAAVQAISIVVTAPSTEGNAPLGASVWALANLLATKIVFVLVGGESGLRQIAGSDDDPVFGVAIVVALMIFGAGLVAAIAWRGGPSWQLLLVFALLITAGSLAWPPASVYSDLGYWQALAVPGNGNRYFFVPLVVFSIGLVRLATDGSTWVRRAGIGLVAVVVLGGVRGDWREPPLRDFEYRQYVEAYDRARPGDKVQIVHPPGWSFTLTKR
ncbi:MAG: hypothetical protein IPF82_03110 [Blastocatellia bacterium]|nr:hypothetical protein [Blastocatellia bacterium]